MKLNKDLNIFGLLDVIDKTNDLNTYDYEDDDINKLLKNEVWMTNKYMLGCSSPALITLHNEYINPYVFSLGAKHHELYYRVASLLRDYDNHNSRRYKWVYPKKAKSSKK